MISLKRISSFLLIAVFSFSLFSMLDNTKSEAVTARDWKPGRIIDDAVFFNKDAMSPAQIQQFLNSKVPVCNTNFNRSFWLYGHWNSPPWTCIKDYQENGKSAAQIIWEAGQRHGINPQVLIITLQKETAIITDTWAAPWQYKRATGYLCPDSKLGTDVDANQNGCYDSHESFTAQINGAAWQLKRYTQFPDSFNFKAGVTRNIRWSPNSACGSSPVYIETQGTAALYNYTPYQPNAAALNNMYGTGDNCSTYGNRNFWRMFNDWFGPTIIQQSYIISKAYTSFGGWMDNVSNNGVIGTTGKSNPMEAFKIIGNVEYTSYNEKSGWQPIISNGMISGSTSQEKFISAVKISPTKSLYNSYDLYYRVHVNDIGWLGWTKNGEIAGITGDSTKKIEAIELFLTYKNSPVPGSMTNSYINKGQSRASNVVGLSISSHVGEIGWQPSVNDGMYSGTTEMSKQIEAIKINLINSSGLSGNIKYTTHVQDLGWQDIKINDEVSGTTAQRKQVEAISIGLSGQLDDRFDLWYRTHVERIGWLGWTKNGQVSGTTGKGLQIEAIETRLVDKNSVNLSQNGQAPFVGSTTRPSYSISYSTHVRNTGWISGIREGSTGGTTGKAKPLEAIRFDIIRSFYPGEINIKCKYQSKGDVKWSADTGAMEICGTTGKAKPLEAISLSLSGDLSNKYSILYRTHLSNLGWQQWSSDGELSGDILRINSIEAIEVKLKEK